jgi:uncharacterized protein YecT (DUF1311 family)
LFWKHVLIRPIQRLFHVAADRSRVPGLQSPASFSGYAISIEEQAMKRTVLRSQVIVAAALAAVSCGAAAANAARPPTTADVLNACQSAIGNQPRTAMQGCLKGELKKAREVLRAAYAQVETDLRKIDASATPDALHALKRSQDSFDSFLRKECKRQGAALLGGSGAGDTELACQVALTRWRVAQLRAD